MRLGDQELSLGSLTEGEVDLEEGNLTFLVPRKNLSRSLEIVKGLVAIRA